MYTKYVELSSDSADFGKLKMNEKKVEIVRQLKASESRGVSRPWFFKYVFSISFVR